MCTNILIATPSHSYIAGCKAACETGTYYVVVEVRRIYRWRFEDGLCQRVSFCKVEYIETTPQYVDYVGCWLHVSDTDLYARCDVNSVIVTHTTFILLQYYHSAPSRVPSTQSMYSGHCKSFIAYIIISTQEKFIRVYF